MPGVKDSNYFEPRSVVLIALGVVGRVSLNLPVLLMLLTESAVSSRIMLYLLIS